MQWFNKSTNEGGTWISIVEDFVNADIYDVACVNEALWVCYDEGPYKPINEGSS